MINEYMVYVAGETALPLKTKKFVSISDALYTSTCYILDYHDIYQFTKDRDIFLKNITLKTRISIKNIVIPFRNLKYDFYRRYFVPLSKTILRQFTNGTKAISMNSPRIDGIKSINIYSGKQDNTSVEGEFINLLNSDDDILINRLIGGTILYNPCYEQILTLMDF